MNGYPWIPIKKQSKSICHRKNHEFGGETILFLWFSYGFPEIFRRFSSCFPTTCPFKNHQKNLRARAASAAMLSRVRCKMIFEACSTWNGMRSAKTILYTPRYIQMFGYGMNRIINKVYVGCLHIYIYIYIHVCILYISSYIFTCIF